MEKLVKSSKQIRVIMWSVPRSVSTAFEFAMAHTENSVILHEPFCFACYFGEERINEFPLQFTLENQGYTFQETRDKLEGGFEGADVVFCNDKAFGVSLPGKLDFIPDGYQHTFLIRNPKKQVPSYVRTSLESKLWQESYLPKLKVEDFGFHGLAEVLGRVTKPGQTPIIIDADDLLKNPEGVLKEYCRLTGIPYTSKMLKYHAKIENWPEASNTSSIHTFHEKALSSRGFGECTPIPDNSKESQVIQNIIEQAMPIYEDLYKRRLRVE